MTFQKTWIGNPQQHIVINLMFVVIQSFDNCDLLAYGPFESESEAESYRRQLDDKSDHHLDCSAVRELSK